MIFFILLIIIFILLFNKTIEYYSSIPNEDNIINNTNLLNKGFTNNRKLL